MSQKEIGSNIQQKIKNLIIPQTQYKEIFNQFFTDQFKLNIGKLIANQNDFFLSYDQIISDYNANSNKQKQNGENNNNNNNNVVQEEFENPQNNQQQEQNQFKNNLNITNVEQLTGFICFLKGLFLETGFLNNGQEECSKALISYSQGINLQADSLCALRLAEIYSSSKIAQKFGLKANPEIAYTYLIIADAYLDVQYNNNLINVNKQVEQISINFQDQYGLAIQMIQKHSTLIFNGLSEAKIQLYLDQIDTLLSFKHSPQTESQEKYNKMVENIGKQDDANSLLLLIKILSKQTHNSNKQVKKIVDLCKNSKIQSIYQALQLILSDTIILSMLERDHEVFNCIRNTFIEIVTFLKIISLETQILIPYSTSDQSINPIHSKIFHICELIFQKKHIFKNQLHNVLIIRIKSDLLRKGIGIKQNLEEALETIEVEKELKKGQLSLYAYYYYKKSRLLFLLRKPIEEINSSLDQAKEYFLERLSSVDLTTQVLARYYLGKIYSQDEESQRKAQEQFNLAIQDFKNNEEKFNQVKTFQFELLERKSKKILESFDLSKLIESRVSVQSTQKFMNFEDGITLQLKVELVQKENGFVFFDQSLFDIIEFIAKGEIGSTSLGKIKYNLLDEIQSNIIRKQDTLAQPHTHYMTNGAPRESILKERVMIKQIPFNKNNYFDRIFHHLTKLQKVKGHEGLLKQKGFCIFQINDFAFELWIVYPKLEYNLYAMIKQNILETITQKIQFALQLADALKNLHDHNSYHGNIKPSNILIDNTKKAYFNDWEFSNKMYHKQRIIKNSKSKTKNGETVLSPNIEDDDSIDANPLYSDGYIAPEIFKNPQAAQFTGSISDIWSLGNDPSFCGLVQEQKLYEDKDLKISRELISNQQIRDLIESMVKNDPSKRMNIYQVKEILQNLNPSIQNENKQTDLLNNHSQKSLRQN